MSRKQQILIVDDTYENLKLATVFLRESGFDILATKSGKQALNVLEKVSPDIILLDVRMPEMDGF
ncbi:MAG TPA: hypothetical protein DCE56_03610, partial [Cyanobacteria bacterium UBA8553]|nr:hypothetical protein [Cyanobacteria bacterium UBA8553]